MDATVDWLTGATIQRVIRRGVYLELETIKAGESHLVILGANRIVAEDECYGCGETRSVDIVETAGQRERVCSICGRSWKVL
jgi:formamidopyrimidine-DNA glycosylase